MVSASPLEKAAQTLRWHAGLEANECASVASLSECLSGGALGVTSLELALSDCVGALSQLNLELNGARPSESVVGAADVPRVIAYAVAEISRLLRGAAAAPNEPSAAALVRAADIVETAWLAVLAGDIDDLRDHVMRERLQDP